MGFLSDREKVGLTQKEVAEAIGVDQSAVSFWETGKTAPRASVLVRLAGGDAGRAGPRRHPAGGH